MKTFVKDPLLLAARGLIIFLMVCLAIGAAALVVGAVVLAVEPASLMVEFAKEGLTRPDGTTLGAIIAIMAIGLVVVGLMMLFLLNLKRVVDSVGARDPFNPENARRLANMGWLALAIELASLPVDALAAWVSTEVSEIDLEIGFSPDGIILALVLFILARVFRQGAAMRDDLEGTV